MQSPEYLWQSIIKLFAQVGSRHLLPIRVLFYTAHTLKGSQSIRKNFRSLKHFLALFFRFKPFVGTIPSNSGLFLFSPGTPSSSNNLLPVLNAAVNLGHQVLVITGFNVKLAWDKPEKKVTIINIRELLASTSLILRTNASLQALSSLALLLYGATKFDFRMAMTTMNNFFKFFYDLYISILTKNVFSKLYNDNAIDYLISANNLYSFEYAVYEQARKCRIPSYVIQHGVINYYWWPFEGDFLLVWGKLFYSEMLKLGTPASRLKICGMPATDRIFAHNAQLNLKKFNTKTNTIVILSQSLAGSAKVQLRSNFEAFLNAVLKATPNMKWTVKLHPSEDGFFYKSLADSKALSILPKSTSLESAVNSADVVCTLFSTAGLEAMIMQKPLLVLNLHNLVSQFAWWPKNEGGIYVHNVNEMCQLLHKLQVDPQFHEHTLNKQNNFLNFAFQYRGNSSEAILNFIESTCRSVVA